MSNKTEHLEASTGVERACHIVRKLYNHARGNYETDQQCIAAIARQSRLTPAAVRRFIQPSRRPKDVSFGVWSRLVGAYRRHLARELMALQDEIDRIEYLSPDDSALQDLLHKARNLVSEAEIAAGAVPPASDRSE